MVLLPVPVGRCAAGRAACEHFPDVSVRCIEHWQGISADRWPKIGVGCVAVDRRSSPGPARGGALAPLLEIQSHPRPRRSSTGIGVDQSFAASCSKEPAVGQSSHFRARFASMRAALASARAAASSSGTSTALPK